MHDNNTIVTSNYRTLQDETDNPEAELVFVIITIMITVVFYVVIVGTQIYCVPTIDLRALSTCRLGTGLAKEG